MGLKDRVVKAFSTDESELSRHGRAPIPGEATLSLPAGEVKLTYQQGFIDSGFFTVPKELGVTVTEPAGEEEGDDARDREHARLDGYQRT
jgi:hypothetical protein